MALVRLELGFDSTSASGFVTWERLQWLSRGVSSTEFQNDSRLPGSSVSWIHSSVVGIAKGVTPFEDSSVGIGDTASV